MSSRTAWLLAIALGLGAEGSSAVAADVTGRVTLPPVCSTTASPAVVSLEPVGAVRPAGPSLDESPRVRVVGQKGLRFEPRVVALARGEVLSFGNGDAELHNVHVVKSRPDFNRNVAPGETQTFAPAEPGV